jgi:addiction module HigA family antidote
MSIRVSPPIHPGEILREEFLAPLNLKPYTLAKKLRTSRAHMERLVCEEAPVTVDTALRLGKFFGTTPDFWLYLQSAYDLDRRRERGSRRLVERNSSTARRCVAATIADAGKLVRRHHRPTPSFDKLGMRSSE